MLESSSKFTPNYHLNTVIDTEAPATSGGTPPAPEAPKNNPNKKRNRNIVLGAVGVVAAGALAATLAVGLGSGNKSQGEQPPKVTETSAPADPTEKPAVNSEYDQPALTGEALTQAFTMPESLSGDDLAKTFIQKIQAWSQYGENTITKEAHVGSSGAPDILESQAQTGGQTIAEALIASENITSPLMTNFESKMIQDNISITDAWTKTYFKDKADNPFPEVNKEAFNQTLEFNSTENVSTDDTTGETTMDIHFTQHTDLKNLVDPTQGSTINPDNAGFTHDNVEVTWRVIFVHENGATKTKSVIVLG